METINQFWSDTLEIPGARWILVFSGLLICVVIAVYVVKIFRDMALGKANDPVSHISDFQKLRDEGMVDEEEYTRLAKSIPRNIPAGDQKIQSAEVPGFKELPETTD